VGTVTDLGTEFAVDVDEEGVLETHVLVGEVALTTGESTQRLKAGQAVRLVRAESIEQIVLDRAAFAPPRIRLSLANGGFETKLNMAGKLPRSTGEWRSESTTIVAAENGIQPFEGQQMLRILHADPTGSGRARGAEVYQAIDLMPLAAEIAQGRVSITLSARFNRVPGDRQTDTEFALSAWTHHGPLATFNPDRPSAPAISTPLQTDGDPATWQPVTLRVVPPTDAQFLIVQLFAGENVFNDVRGVEFDGHYADDVQLALTISPEGS
jgi:hypothetical protein